MRILDLAKELGISWKRLLEWMEGSRFHYRSPNDEVASDHETQIRQAFSRAHKQKPLKTDDLPEDEPDLGLFLEESDLPETLEELEALERSMTSAPMPGSGKTKKQPKRIPTAGILEQYGISGKSTLKKLRKILSGPGVRLLNQQSLLEDRSKELKKEIESKAVFFCDHAFCREALAERHPSENLIPVRNSSCCRLCKGSVTRRSLEETAQACRKGGIRRILVVGGMPASQREFRDNAPEGLEFRLVEGEVERRKDRAQADLQWCDLCVIWGATPLGHSVSSHYTRRRGQGGPFVIRVDRRSVEAVCSAIIKHLKR